MCPTDEDAAEDAIWLREQIIAFLQKQIAPGVMGDWSHAYTMKRARRLLRLLEVEPISECTEWERAARRVIVRVPLIRLVMREPEPQYAKSD